MSSTSALAVAQLAIYAPLSPPLLYNLFRHGRHGFLGWLYLLIFCVLRLTGSALSLSTSSSNSATVISNVGLSPLLLGTLGITHEGRAHHFPNLDRNHEIQVLVAMYVLIAMAIALIASGVSALTSASADSNDVTLLKIGVILMMPASLVIAIVTMVSLVVPVRKHEHPVLKDIRRRDEMRLLYAVLIFIPLTGIRVLYSVAEDFTQSASLNPIAGSLALRVCLSILPEMLVVILFIGVGLWRRNIAQK